MIYQSHKFLNGIRIVHRYCDSYISHCGIIVNAGSRDEAEQEKGIAHFIEHTVFKGTHKRKPYQILSHLENVGGEINAFTSKEETCYYASFLNKYLERALELLHDIFTNATFPEKEINKEKDVVIDEINAYRDNPSDEIFDEFEKMSFPSHSLSGYVLGEPKCIKRFNKKSIEKFISRAYNTDEIIICSVGKIDFSDLVTMVGKYFSSIKSNKRKWQRPKFNNYKPYEQVIKKSIHQTHCMIGNIAYSHNDKRKTPLILLNNILGGPGMNSRLSMNIREKYGFCYHIESSYTSFVDTGIFSIYMGTDSENIEKTIQLVYKELDKLRNDKLGVLQLHRAKLQLIGQVAISYEHNLNEMLSMAKSFLVYNKVDTLEDINKKIDAITVKQLLDTANDIFNSDKLSKLIYKPDK